MRKYFTDDISEISDKNQEQMDTSYLLFTVSGETFGIQISDVQVIMQKPELRKVPDMPQYIIGLTHYRGIIYPVMDIRERFQLSQIEDSERTPLILLNVESMHIGIIVDDILEVTKIDDKDLLDIPNEKTGFFNRFVKGILEKNSALIYIINNNTLFVNEKEYIQEINSRNI